MKVTGPRAVPARKKGVEKEYLVIVKTENRIEHSRFFRLKDAKKFKKEVSA